MILIPRRAVFALTPLPCLFSGEVADCNFISIRFDLTGARLPVCHSRDEHVNHYTKRWGWNSYKYLRMIKCIKSKDWEIFNKDCRGPGCLNELSPYYTAKQVS